MNVAARFRDPHLTPPPKPSRRQTNPYDEANEQAAQLARATAQLETSTITAAEIVAEHEFFESAEHMATTAQEAARAREDSMSINEVSFTSEIYSSETESYVPRTLEP